MASTRTPARTAAQASARTPAQQAATRDEASSPPVALVAAALLVVYVVWGSTYLAIRVVVREAPPLTSMGMRYLSAGVVLGLLLACRGGVRRLAIRPRQLAGAALLGLLLPALGNGAVAWGEASGAPSGLAALLIAATPLWIAVFRVLARDRPAPLTVAGVLLGFVGQAVLVIAGRDGGQRLPLLATGVIAVASFSWALGSFVQPRIRLPEDTFVTTAYVLACGGALLLAAGLASGEQLGSDYRMQTWAALGYLVVFGSLIAFTAYVWLLDHARLSLVSTYAYVNPVVAVVLGWLLLAEPLTAPLLLGGGIVVLAVAIVIAGERPSRGSGSGAP